MTGKSGVRGEARKGSASAGVMLNVKLALEDAAKIAGILEAVEEVGIGTEGMCAVFDRASFAALGVRAAQIAQSAIGQVPDGEA